MNQMHTAPGCHVERVTRAGTGEVTMVVRSSHTGAPCPICRMSSSASHSTYVRRLADLPSLGHTVQLELHVRRFYCLNPSCHRRTFAERLLGLLDVRARRTRRFASAQTAVAVEVGGEAGARLLGRLAIPTSPDTLVRGSFGALRCRASEHCAPSASTTGQSGNGSPTAPISSIWELVASSNCCPTGPPRHWPPGSADDRRSR